MSRPPQVSRTICTTLAEVLILDILNERPEIREIRVPRSYNTDRKLINRIQAALNDPNLKVVHIRQKRVQTLRCTMTEQKYIETADILEIIEQGENDNE